MISITGKDIQVKNQINKRKKLTRNIGRNLTLFIIIGTILVNYKAISRVIEFKVLGTTNVPISELYNVKGEGELKAKRLEILKNYKLYTPSLIEAAMKKDELVDFVLDYPKYKHTNKAESIATENNETKDGYPIFLQWDSRWGYEKYGDDVIGLNGCAPTVMAMVISGLTDHKDVNPKTLAKYSSDHNFYVYEVGTSWKFISNVSTNYGLTTNESVVSTKNIRNSLSSGKPVVISVGKGTFTSTGHFLLLTSIDKDDKVTIIDPYSKNNTEKTWDISIFETEGVAMWSISK